MARKEWEDTLNKAVADFTKNIGDLSKLNVVTEFVVVSEGTQADFSQAKPIAQTTIELDGDYRATVPMRPAKEGDDGPQVDMRLYELHQENVDKALMYRAEFINSVMHGLRSLI